MSRAESSARRRPCGQQAAGRLLTGLPGLLLFGLLPGCPPGEVRQPSLGTPPIDEREALARVNENLARLEYPLLCNARASFTFRDGDGRRHSFLRNDARLIYAPERYLLIDVRSLAGVIAQFGSNDERYWVWIDPELRKLWWGTWSQVAEVPAQRLPLPPDLLLDALMFRPLPRNNPREVGPILRMEASLARLVYMRAATSARPAIMREIILDPAPPYQPREIIDRRADGQIAMHARLDKYDRVDKVGPYIPRRYRVEWPSHEARLELDLDSARFQRDVTPDLFEFPERWRGAVEALDPAWPLRQPELAGPPPALDPGAAPTMPPLTTDRDSDWAGWEADESEPPPAPLQPAPPQDSPEIETRPQTPSETPIDPDMAQPAPAARQPALPDPPVTLPPRAAPATPPAAGGSSGSSRRTPRAGPADIFRERVDPPPTRPRPSPRRTEPDAPRR